MRTAYLLGSPAAPRRAWRLRLPVELLIVLLVLSVGGVQAATITVAPGAVDLNPGDGICSLKEAIHNANDDGVDHSGGDCALGDGADTIVLAEGSVYAWTEIDNELDGLNGLPPLTSDIVVEGNGASLQACLRIGCSPTYRILYVGATANVVLRNLGVLGGGSAGYSSSGAGIYNRGTLLLENSNVDGNNTEAWGGGIYNIGTLTLVSSSVSYNLGDDGGGIHNVGTLTAFDSRIDGNTSTDLGGGLFTWTPVDDAVRLVRTSVSYNRAEAGGGGINNYGDSPMVTLSECAVNNNWVIDGTGGGIHGRAALFNCTVSGNYSFLPWDPGDDELYLAGAIRGYALLVNSTVANNEAPAGGGISEGTARNSIIAGNRAAGRPLGSPAADCASVTSLGYNIFGAGTGCDSDDPTDQFIDPALVFTDLLGSLTGNRGPAQLHPLLEGSIALDAASCTDHEGEPVTVDQRGAPRASDDPAIPNADGGCDVGAYELQVEVVDVTPPVITLAEPLLLWPPSGQAAAVTLADAVVSITDDVDGELPVSAAYLTGASSDEAAPKKGTDITLSTDCRTAELAADRDGGGNGRVYTLEVAARDAAGNVGTASYAVQVPHNQRPGGEAVDDGPAYTVVSACGTPTTERWAQALSSRWIAPTRSGLSAAYPNPFNPRTHLRLTVAEAQHVRVEVFNMLGQRVAVLLDEALPGGESRLLTFDAADLPSGVYLFRAQGETFEDAGRVTLLK